MAARRAGLAKAFSAGRRAWPVVLMAWERWQQLPEEDKEKLRRRARQYADTARKRRGGPGGFR